MNREIVMTLRKSPFQITFATQSYKAYRGVKTETVECDMEVT